MSLFTPSTFEEGKFMKKSITESVKLLVVDQSWWYRVALALQQRFLTPIPQQSWVIFGNTFKPGQWYSACAWLRLGEHLLLRVSFLQPSADLIIIGPHQQQPLFLRQRRHRGLFYYHWIRNRVSKELSEILRFPVAWMPCECSVLWSVWRQLVFSEILSSVAAMSLYFFEPHYCVAPASCLPRYLCAARLTWCFVTRVLHITSMPHTAFYNLRNVWRVGGPQLVQTRR